MNKIQKLITVIVGVIGCFAMIAFGQVLQPLPLPATWVAANGDYFRLKSNAGVEMRVGTNTYTGVSTNIALTNAVSLRFVNGVAVAVGAEVAP